MPFERRSHGNSSSEEFDELGRDPHFSSDDVGPYIRRCSVFISYADISWLVRSNSECNDGEQKDTIC